MPRHYFHLFDDIVVLDEEGAELPDIDSAEAYAQRCARDVIAGQACDGMVSLWHGIEVADEQGAVLRTVLFRDAVEVVAQADWRAVGQPLPGHMLSNWELWACANHYVIKHGDQAGVVSAKRCDELLGASDYEGARNYQAILERIAILQDTTATGPVH